MIASRKEIGGRRLQAGISLFPAMMFLLILTVLGIGALNSALMEEKMVGNTKDTNLAFQMAEAGLRDAETDITNNITSSTVFTSACTSGLCTPPSTWPTPTSTDVSKAIDWTNTGVTRTYGAYTGAAALGLVAAQPVYVIEKLSKLPRGPGRSVGLGVAPPPSAGIVYRITVLATGVRPETKVMLQSTYAMRDP
jgi:type IV pilus assembly protein PilX